MRISAAFDAGSIDVVSLDSTSGEAHLRIPNDAHSEFAQWFYFRLEGATGKDCTLVFDNAASCAYPEGWVDYQAVASYDRENWFRVPTRYDGQTMQVSITPQHDVMYFAYFEPYTWERHLSLMSKAQLSDICRLHHLGTTLDGRDLDMLQVGEDAAGKRKIWLTARQHPGETMAEWFVEGVLLRLLDPDDALARRLLQQAVFYIVPNMNPDGSCRGHLRTNAAGVNLNREWANPSMNKSPEVYLVREKMRQTGVDVFLDAHGDESIPFNFVAGSEGNPGYHVGRAELENTFKSSWLAVNPDFQVTHGYAPDQFGEANMTLATNHVADYFDCLAYTIEMPFKDNNDLPDADTGWSGERSRQLGASVLYPLAAVLAKLG
ncbi:M14 family metallopeptidase [Leeia oryzae]|uniref:M14 family metallopeptidase n=1 Tax=Leeia oryzae TaxID=356662 RepID=UPI00036C80F6|nr:M14-type cytosolic carboxypeptidase [Leeia oryzae]